jgi:dipeptidyl aminopeptidase/acylaminoacyl peptidase
MREIRVRSSLDGSEEPALLRPAPADDPAPLLVGLHTWSYDRFNAVDLLAPLAERNGWHLLLPEFRGPNRSTNPRAAEACGSALAVRDVLDAVDAARALAPVAEEAVLLAGVSGGGHMTLLVAAAAPERFRAAVAFCPITDLAAWHAENPDYAAHVAACCGGDPSPATEAVYRERSPLRHAARLARTTVLLRHGRFDPVVSAPHSLRLYEAVTAADPEARIFLDIFDGGHEMPVAMLERALLGQVSGGRETEEATG